MLQSLKKTLEQILRTSIKLKALQAHRHTHTYTHTHSHSKTKDNKSFDLITNNETGDCNKQLRQRNFLRGFQVSSNESCPNDKECLFSIKKY